MTWSIIAHEETTGRVGVIVASGSFACGAHVPRISTGVGAVASQGLVNPLAGPQMLALLRAGASAEDVVRLLTAADDGRAIRQLHVMDAHGLFAAHTGEGCAAWSGHEISAEFSVAGHELSGPEVLAATVKTYVEGNGTPLARRLIAAMQAGKASGGGNAAQRSAALLVHDNEEYALLDLRVDHHTDPLAELARLEGLARERWLHLRRALPSVARPSGVTDAALVEQEIAQSVAEGYA
jgi:uncharacterized Ntn-hydrolase superfamily protein